MGYLTTPASGAVKWELHGSSLTWIDLRYDDHRDASMRMLLACHPTLKWTNARANESHAAQLFACLLKHSLERRALSMTTAIFLTIFL